MTLPAPVAAALRDGAIAAVAPVAVIELAGAGSIAALQGLLTNDVEKPGDGAFIYGALLTPKGMVIIDGWVGRTGNRATYTVPAAARERTVAIFTRSVPPRMARTTDRSDELRVLRLAGPRAIAVAQAAGIPLPSAAGRTIAATAQRLSFDVALPGEAGPPPFALQISGSADAVDALQQRLVATGAHAADADALELARILAGWPSIETEADDKTLPQEIRFDEIAGVSYTKGCYTGQETVSRVHFRGHTNRSLRGLLFDSAPDDSRAVLYQDREAGNVTSLAWLPQGGGGRWIGLALLRREVTPGAMVRAGGADARVVDLPFAPTYVVPA